MSYRPNGPGGRLPGAPGTPVPQPRLHQPPLVVGGSYVLRLNHGARFLNLPGRVAWCRPVRLEVTARGRRTIYQAGVELRRAEPDPRWRAALAERAGVAVGV